MKKMRNPIKRLKIWKILKPKNRINEIETAIQNVSSELDTAKESMKRKQWRKSTQLLKKTNFIITRIKTGEDGHKDY
jgi:flagellin-specific chaperone FliS